MQRRPPKPGSAPPRPRRKQSPSLHRPTGVWGRAACCTWCSRGFRRMATENSPMEDENAQEEPKPNVQKGFEELDRFNSEPFFPDRKQPVTPERKIFE